LFAGASSFLFLQRFLLFLYREVVAPGQLGFGRLYCWMINFFQDSLAYLLVVFGVHHALLHSLLLKLVVLPSQVLVAEQLVGTRSKGRIFLKTHLD
jgi:hypothetical protein